MGLGKKLGQLNSNDNTQAQNAINPLSIGGYNSNNIPSLPVAISLNDIEKNEIKILEAESINEYTHHAILSNSNNLVKPKVPTGIEYPCTEISSLIVEKMWRIICLRGLFNFYTQEFLQTLVNRA